MDDILLIEDDLDYCQLLAKLAKVSNKFNIIFFNNHKQGFEELNKNPHKYKALILDAKCLKDEYQKTPSDDALAVALDLLLEFEHKTKLYLPFIVNTAYGDFAQYFESMVQSRGGKIFAKEEDTDALFAYLTDKINNSENTQIERRYADAFYVFAQGYFTESRADLLKILKEMESAKSEDIKSNLALIRMIKEKIIKHEITQNTRQPILIKTFSGVIDAAANNYGSHDTKQDCIPSAYTVISSAYALLELLCWFKNEIPT